MKISAILSRPTRILWVLLAAVLLPSPSGAQGVKLGAISFPTSSKPAARPLFLRGVALLHSFEYEDAAEAFRKAQTIDPAFALAYWGEALTYDHPLWGEQDSTAARAVLLRLAPTAEARASKARTEREKAYLQAVEVLYGAGDKLARATAYVEAMRTIHEMYPSDMEARTLYALALLGASPSRSTDLRPRVEAAAAADVVFRRNPEHPGAAHYLIHAYDDPVLAPLGLPAALSYARIAPAAQHAVHMPSHIFLQLGRWDDVVASNEKAFSASQAWARKKGHPASQYDFHSLYWLHYGYLQQGRYRLARALEDSARAMLAAEKGNMPMWAEMGPTLMGIQYLAEAGTRNSLPPDSTRDPTTASYAIGLASAERKDTAQLRSAENRIRAHIDSVKTVSKPMRVSLLVLEAHRARLEGSLDRAMSILERAAVLEDSVRAVGPAYGVPIREALGDLLLERGDAEKAATQYELALLRTPNRSRALLGRARAAVMARDERAATRFYHLVLRNWRNADGGTRELEEARAWIARRS